jgi:hypothetical protein
MHISQWRFAIGVDPNRPKPGHEIPAESVDRQALINVLACGRYTKAIKIATLVYNHTYFI